MKNWSRTMRQGYKNDRFDAECAIKEFNEAYEGSNLKIRMGHNRLLFVANVDGVAEGYIEMCRGCGETSVILPGNIYDEDYCTKCGFNGVASKIWFIYTGSSLYQSVTSSEGGEKRAIQLARSLRTRKNMTDITVQGPKSGEDIIWHGGMP